MNFRLLLLLGGAAILLAGGCATMRTRAPVPPRETASAIPVTPGLEIPPAGRLQVRVESQPAGALIVSGGGPAGHTPLTLEVAATPQGFFAAPLMLRARFLATDARGESVSVEQDFTPLDKVPAAILFTTEGATRTAR